MKTLTVYGDNAGARYLVERDGGEVSYAHHYWEDIDNLEADIRAWRDEGGTAGWDGNDWGETVSEEDPDNLEEIETMNGEVGL